MFGDDLPQPGERSVLSGDAALDSIGMLLPKLIGEGYSQRKAMSYFRNLGYSFSNAPFSEVYREILGIGKRSDRILSAPFDQPIASTYFDIPRFKTGLMTSEYRFTVVYDSIDRVTGDKKRAYINLEMDSLFNTEGEELTKEGILDIANNFLDTCASCPEKKTGVFNISRAFKRG